MKVPDTRLIVTLIASPGVTLQFASPLQPVNWVSLAGGSSYQA
jgi:hypothetical protein